MIPGGPVTLTDFTVHGREPAGTPPFFHAERLEVGLRIDSVWARKFSLGDVEIVHPMVHVRVEHNGSINVPMARMSASSKPLRQRIFEVAARRLRLTDGEMLLNDVRVPLVAEGAQFDFAVDYAERIAKSCTWASSDGNRWNWWPAAICPFIPTSR